MCVGRSPLSVFVSPYDSGLRWACKCGRPNERDQVLPSLGQHDVQTREIDGDTEGEPASGIPPCRDGDLGRRSLLNGSTTTATEFGIGLSLS